MADLTRYKCGQTTTHKQLNYHAGTVLCAVGCMTAYALLPAYLSSTGTVPLCHCGWVAQQRHTGTGLCANGADGRRLIPVMHSTRLNGLPPIRLISHYCAHLDGYLATILPYYHAMTRHACSHGPPPFSAPTFLARFSHRQIMGMMKIC